jgi:hypothetical protein
MVRQGRVPGLLSVSAELVRSAATHGGRWAAGATRSTVTHAAGKVFTSVLGVLAAPPRDLAPRPEPGGGSQP